MDRSPRGLTSSVTSRHPPSLHTLARRQVGLVIGLPAGVSTSLQALPSTYYSTPYAIAYASTRPNAPLLRYIPHPGFTSAGWWFTRECSMVLVVVGSSPLSRRRRRNRLRSRIERSPGRRHECLQPGLVPTFTRPPSPLAHSEGGQCDRTVFPGCLTVSGLYNKWPCSRSQTPT